MSSTDSSSGEVAVKKPTTGSRMGKAALSGGLFGAACYFLNLEPSITAAAISAGVQGASDLLTQIMATKVEFGHFDRGLLHYAATGATTVVALNEAVNRPIIRPKSIDSFKNGGISAASSAVADMVYNYLELEIDEFANLFDMDWGA